MKALTFNGLETITYETVSDPVLVNSNDVIIKVQGCAICGSDLHVYYGRETGIDKHTCMGHEFAGEVVEVGKEVKSLHIGDVVISPFSVSCGECFYCKIGLTSRCVKSRLFGWVENGIGLHGGQSEFVRVPLSDSSLMKLPEGISMEEGVLAGDIISTGFYSSKQAQIKPQGVYVVIGCGPVGLMAILGALTYGAEKIYAVDREVVRLQMAEKFGAIPINTATADALNIIQNASEGRQQEFKEILKKILLTKFQAWNYEDEVRIFIERENQDGHYYFYHFDKNIRLTQVIAGLRCAVPRNAIEEKLRSYPEHIEIIKARLSLDSFEVIADIGFS